MDTTILSRAGLQGKVQLKKVMYICGILSALLYIAMNIFIPPLLEGYSSKTQTVSELSAVGTSTRMLWLSLGVVYTLLITVFGWGVWKSAAQNRRLRVVGLLIFISGIISVVWPFTPMHQREALAAGEGSLTDTLHIAMGMVTILLWIITVGTGAGAFGKRFRIFSIATFIILLVSGGLTGSESPNINSNGPTPWIGVWERAFIGVFLVWIIVLAIILLRKLRSQQ